MRYFVGFTWGFVLLASFAGWGHATCRILKLSPEGEVPDWGRAIVLGMSWIIALGGFLNLLRVMTWGAVLTLLIIGLALFAVGVWQLRLRRGWSGVSDWPITNIELV